MKLTLKGITENREEWLSKGYRLSEFDIPAMVQKTKEAPEWVHFGGGNIFRAFHANLMQDLLNQGLSETGIIVCEGYDYEIAEKMYRPHDNLSILATLKASGSVEKTVIGSIAESCELDSENAAEFGRMREIFAKESLSMATFTITEKGYSLTNAMGELLPPVAYDLANGPEKPQSYIGKVASLLYTRFENGRKPIAMVSTDNCSHNGDKLAAAMHAFAEAWEKAGLAKEGFTAWVDDPSAVSFPWSMIDKITPRPAPSVEEMLRADDLDGLDPVVTTKGTHVAPFVNAEESQYLVIEDKFPNGRPAL
ncbi:MAG: mannitol dehydrogenase family protein, partial [Lachnospiraceae bacterium]|nr:mannitol dehydrogenase family protein [Lachnospiraceae bacterium]